MSFGNNLVEQKKSLNLSINNKNQTSIFTKNKKNNQK